MPVPRPSLSMANSKPIFLAQARRVASERESHVGGPLRAHPGAKFDSEILICPTCRCSRASAGARVKCARPGIQAAAACSRPPSTNELRQLNTSRLSRAAEGSHTKARWVFCIVQSSQSFCPQHLKAGLQRLSHGIRNSTLVHGRIRCTKHTASGGCKR